MYLIIYLIGIATNGLLLARARHHHEYYTDQDNVDSNDGEYSDNPKYVLQVFKITDHHLDDAIKRNTPYETNTDPRVDYSYKNCRQKSVKTALDRLHDDEDDDDTNIIINHLVSEAVACRNKAFLRSGKTIPPVRNLGSIAVDLKNFVQNVLGFDKRKTSVDVSEKDTKDGKVKYITYNKTIVIGGNSGNKFEHEVTQQRIDLNKILHSLINYFNSKKKPKNSQAQKDNLLNVFRTIEEYLYNRNQSSSVNNENTNNKEKKDELDTLLKYILGLRNQLAGAGEKQLENSISQVIKIISNNKTPKTSNIQIIIQNQSSYLKKLYDTIVNILKEHQINSDDVGFFTSVFKEILSYAKTRLGGHLDYDNFDASHFEEEQALEAVFNSMLKFVKKQEDAFQSHELRTSSPEFKRVFYNIRNYLSLVDKSHLPRDEAQIYLINIFKLLESLVDVGPEPSTERREPSSLKKILDMSIKFRKRINGTQIEGQAVKEFVNLLFKEIFNYQQHKNGADQGNKDIDKYFNEVVKAIEVYLRKLEHGDDVTSEIAEVFKKIEMYLKILGEISDSDTDSDTDLIVEKIFNEILNFASFYNIDKRKDYDNTPYLKRILSLLANFNRPKENGTQKALTFLDRMFDAIIYYRDTQISKSVLNKAPLNWRSSLLDIVNAMEKYRKSFEDNSVTNAQLTSLFEDIHKYLELYNPTTMKLSGSQYVLNQILEALLHFYYKYKDLLIIDNENNGLNRILEVLLAHTVSTPLKEEEFQSYLFNELVKYRNNVKTDKWGNDVIKKAVDEFYQDIDKYLRSGNHSDNDTPKELLREDVYFDAQNVRFLITEIPRYTEEPWFFQNFMSALLDYRKSLNDTRYSSKADNHINTIYEAILNNNPIWNGPIMHKKPLKLTLAPNINEIINKVDLADLYLDEIFKIIAKNTATNGQSDTNTNKIIKVIVKYLNYKNHYPFIPITYKPKHIKESFVELFKEMIEIILNYHDYDINTADDKIKELYDYIFPKHDDHGPETALESLVKLLLKIYSEVQESDADQDTKTGILWIFNIVFDHIKDIVDQQPDSDTNSALDEILLILKDLVIHEDENLTFLELLLKIISEANKNPNAQQIRVIINVIENIYKIIHDIDWNNTNNQSEVLNYVTIFDKYLENIFEHINNILREQEDLDSVIDYQVILNITKDVIDNHHNITDQVIPDDEDEILKLLYNLFEELIIRLIDPEKAYKIIIKIVNKISEKNPHNQKIKDIVDLITVIIKEIHKNYPDVRPPGNAEIWKEIIDKIMKGLKNDDDIIHIIINIRNATHIDDPNELANELIEILIKILEGDVEPNKEEIEAIWELIIQILKDPKPDSLPEVIKAIIKVIYDVWKHIKDNDDRDIAKDWKLIFELISKLILQIPKSLRTDIKSIIENWQKLIPEIILEWNKIWAEISQYLSILEEQFFELIKSWIDSLMKDITIVYDWMIKLFGNEYKGLIEKIINVIKFFFKNDKNQVLWGKTVISIEQYINDKYNNDKKCFCCEELRKFKAKLLEKGIDIDALEAEIESESSGNKLIPKNGNDNNNFDVLPFVN